MKRTMFFVTCGLLFLLSCDALFVHVSGVEAELQGKWQMDDADTVYFNFQNSLFQYQIYKKKDAMSHVFGYYYLHGDTSLDLTLLREYAGFPLNYLGWDTLYSATGQDTLYKSYKIESLTSKKLILNSSNGKISFHRF